MSLNLLQRINEVRKGIDYIQKDKSVSTGGGSYRAVTHDAVTGVVRQHMVKHGIIVFPFLVESQSMPFEVNADMVRAKQFRYEATYDFTFCNVDDANDKLVVRIQAHAMDNADKAPGKALSYAAKYALLKVFSLETGEDEESRHRTEDVDDEALAQHLKAISEAADMATLQRVFAEAYRAVDKDKEASKLVIRSKDARKKELAEVAQ